MRVPKRRYHRRERATRGKEGRGGSDSYNEKEEFQEGFIPWEKRGKEPIKGGNTILEKGLRPIPFGAKAAKTPQTEEKKNLNLKTGTNGIQQGQEKNLAEKLRGEGVGGKGIPRGCSTHWTRGTSLFTRPFSRLDYPRGGYPETQRGCNQKSNVKSLK